MRKFLSFICITLFSVATFAQSGFRVEIKQVFPNSSLVYSNAFNFKREMDNAIASQSAKLRGNNCNYKVQITTPSGNETRYIQNIVWMESVNDKKKYHKQTTYPQESYDVATVWKGCSCNADGSVKGSVQTHEFLYRVSLGIPNKYETPFLEKNTALAKANELYGKLHVESQPVEVMVLRFMGNTSTVIEKKDNKEEYLAYQERIRIEEEKAAAEKRKQEIINGVAEFKADMCNITDSLEYLTLDDCLNKCQSALEEAKDVIPDSVFVNEKLDSLYKDVLLYNVLLTKEGKKFRKQITMYEDIKKEKNIRALLKHTTDILAIKSNSTNIISSKKAK